MTLGLIMFLVLLGISLIALKFAIDQAKEGYEDDKGFHALPEVSPPSASTSAEGWEYAEGASCPWEDPHGLAH